MVPRERRDEVEERIAGGDEQEVERPEADEEPVAQDGAIRRRLLPVLVADTLGIVHECEHADVREERRGVDEEQHRERGGVRDARDQPARKTTQTDPPPSTATVGR